MEAIQSVCAATCLAQRELRSCAASTSLSCLSSSSQPSLRLAAPRRHLAERACLQDEDVGGRSLSSPRRSRFSCQAPAPLSSGRHHSTRVQSAKKTYSNFEDLLGNTETPLLVDFYATWCGPCQFMVPILDEVGKKLKDKLRIVKIDSEKYPGIASKYHVQALPTLILFQNGQPIDRLEGALSARDLMNRIEGVLSSTSSAKP